VRCARPPMPDDGAPIAHIEDYHPLASAAGWLGSAQIDGRAEPRANLYNAMLALREDPRIADLFAYDEMLRAAMLTSPVPGRVLHGNGEFDVRPVRDDDVSTLQEMLQRAGLEKIGKA